MQGLLAVHQYYANGNDKEKAIAQRIDRLWRGELGLVPQRRTKRSLLALESYLRLGNGFPHTWLQRMHDYVYPCRHSPTHRYLPLSIMTVGLGQGDCFPHKVEGIELHLRYQGTEAGPLFWAQYSFLGLDPVGLKDEYCPSYFHEVRNLTLVNRAYCIRNPQTL